MNVSSIAQKVKKTPEAVTVELGILSENNLIDVERSSNRKQIRRAKINSQGENFFIEKTTIITKETIKEQMVDLKERLTALEEAFQVVQLNPTEENKKSFLEKVNTFVSVANGVTPWVKAGIDIFKSW